MKSPVIALSALLIMSLISYACKQDPRTKFPLFSYRLADSVTVATTADIPKGSPIVLFHFEEDCIDCQEATDSLIMKMAQVSNVQFYFLTKQNFHRLNKFRKHYHFDDYPNITIGQDFHHMLARHYDIYNTPLIALFNSNKRLVQVYSGRPVNQELIKSLQSLQ